MSLRVLELDEQSSPFQSKPFCDSVAPAQFGFTVEATVAWCSSGVGLSIPVSVLSIPDRSLMEGSSLLAKIKTLSNLPEPIKACSLLQAERNTVWGRGYKIHLQGI